MTMNEPELTQFTRLLKAEDVAEILSISKSLAYRLIQQGFIPSVRINRAVRVKPSDLNAFIEQCRAELDEVYPL